MVFEAVLTDGYRGDIALDDISVTDGNCVEAGGKFKPFFLTWTKPDSYVGAYQILA